MVKLLRSRYKRLLPIARFQLHLRETYWYENKLALPCIILTLGSCSNKTLLSIAALVEISRRKTHGRKKTPQQSIQKFRRKNQYDKPVLILFGDIAHVLARNLPPIGLLAVTLITTIWALEYNSTDPENPSNQVTVENGEAEQSPNRAKYVKIGAYNAWRKNESLPEPDTGALIANLAKDKKASELANQVESNNLIK